MTALYSQEEIIREYWKGVEDGISRFAWMRDGTYYVGAEPYAITLKQALEEAFDDREADLSQNCDWRNQVSR